MIDIKGFYLVKNIIRIERVNKGKYMVFILNSIITNLKFMFDSDQAMKIRECVLIQKIFRSTLDSVLLWFQFYFSFRPV